MHVHTHIRTARSVGVRHSVTRNPVALPSAVCVCMRVSPVSQASCVPKHAGKKKKIKLACTRLKRNDSIDGVIWFSCASANICCGLAGSGCVRVCMCSVHHHRSQCSSECSRKKGINRKAKREKNTYMRKCRYERSEKERDEEKDAFLLCAQLVTGSRTSARCRQFTNAFQFFFFFLGTTRRNRIEF